MSCLVTCLCFGLHSSSVIILSSAATACLHFAAFLFFLIYLFSWQSVEWIVFTCILPYMCYVTNDRLQHISSKVLPLRFYDHCHPEQHSLKSPIPERLFFMIMGCFILAKFLLASAAVLYCLHPNCTVSHFSSMAIHHTCRVCLSPGWR